MGSFRTSLFTGDGVSQITAKSLSHHTKSVTHSNRLTVCAQSPCPGPVSLNVSFVSGYLGFPPERGRRVFYFIFFYISLLFVGVKLDKKQTQYCQRLCTCWSKTHFCASVLSWRLVYWLIYRVITIILRYSMFYIRHRTEMLAVFEAENSKIQTNGLKYTISLLFCHVLISLASL